MKKKILIVLLIVLLAIQFYNPNSNNSTEIPGSDFVLTTNPPNEIRNILKKACYDCHSNHTKYPWYAYIAPISYYINEHVEDGKKHLNFSIWSDYSTKKKVHKLKKLIEEVEEGEMPLTPYTWLHSETSLVSIEKEALNQWIKELQTMLDSEEKEAPEEKP